MGVSVVAKEGIVSYNAAGKGSKGCFGFPHGVHEAELIPSGAFAYFLPPYSVELGNEGRVSTEYYPIFG